MTRLSEALERAHLMPAEQPESVWAGVDADQKAAEDVPRTWRFDGDDIVRDAPWSDESPVTQPPDTNVDEYRFGDTAVDKVVVGPHANELIVEQYRRLAAVLHHAQLEHGDRSVMIASAVAAEGKTLTATNLALTLSHSYERRVLLIDADLRRPCIHEMFQLSNRVGLGNSLRHPEGGRLPVQQVLPRLWVLTAGQPDPDPMSSLVSDTMRQLLIDAAAQFDWVVVDTPPVAVLPDANLLAGMIDTALLVVSATTTPYPLVKRATEAIGASRILGVVFNRAERSALADGYGSYEYSYRYQGKAREPRGGARFGFFGKKPV
jgi:protein-tyrosine kinase